MQKIKICGIRRAADIEIINKYRPDYIDTYPEPMQWN